MPSLGRIGLAALERKGAAARCAVGRGFHTVGNRLGAGWNEDSQLTPLRVDGAPTDRSRSGPDARLRGEPASPGGGAAGTTHALKGESSGRAGAGEPRSRGIVSSDRDWILVQLGNTADLDRREQSRGMEFPSRNERNAGLSDSRACRMPRCGRTAASSMRGRWSGRRMSSRLSWQHAELKADAASSLTKTVLSRGGVADCGEVDCHTPPSG